MNVSLYENKNYALAPIGSLESYLNWTHNNPILTAEQEKELTSRLYNNGDLAAAKKLIISHLRFVVYVSKSYQGYGLPLADIIQEGNIGLMKAIKRFNPNVGVRLVSFAVYWIKSEIQEFILKNWRIVKIATTKAQRKLFFNLRKHMKPCSALNKEEITYIASTYNVPEKEVKSMEGRLSKNDYSFDPSLDSDMDNNFSPYQYLESNQSDSPEKNLVDEDCKKRDLDMLNEGMESLDPRSKDIVKKRWLSSPKETLGNLAKYYSISAERVRQLEQLALIHIKNIIAEK